MLKIEPPERVMVIMAHPDDPEFFCGGTIALWRSQGAEVSYLILTNGNKGSDDPEMTPEKLAAIRKEEQQAAADVLGVKRVIYMEAPDGELQPTLELRRRVVSEIRRYRPDTVVAQDPTRYYMEHVYINHADHRAAGEIAIDAVFPAARNRMYHPELLEAGLEPHTVRQVFLAAAAQPNLWINHTALFETKLKAIQAHASQVQHRTPEALAERIRQRSVAIDEYGQEVFREGFRVMIIG